MKVTTVFFKGNMRRVTNRIRYWFKNAFYLVYISILIILFVFFTSHINISTNLIKLASNAKVTNNYEFAISNLMDIYPTLNSNNYIIQEKLDDKVITADTKVKTADQLLDEVCSQEAIATFSNKKDVNVSITNNADIERITIDSMKILNYSSLRQLDYKALYNNIITLTKLSDKILLYNSHTSEAYSNSENYKFSYTGTYRTTDSNYNMLSVAKKLQENLKEKNISAVQDTTPHDYGTYTSAYERSKKTVQSNINNFGNFGISIDLHRDAHADLSYAPKVNINGVDVAKCMFVMGVGTENNRNPYYEKNLSLAIQIQLLADEVYPGLFRPMLIRNSLYNQDLNECSMLIEIGATGNILEEAYNSTRCISNLLDIIYKN